MLKLRTFICLKICSGHLTKTTKVTLPGSAVKRVFLQIQVFQRLSGQTALKVLFVITPSVKCNSDIHQWGGGQCSPKNCEALI